MQWLNLRVSIPTQDVTRKTSRKIEIECKYWFRTLLDWRGTWSNKPVWNACWKSYRNYLRKMVHLRCFWDRLWLSFSLSFEWGLFMFLSAWNRFFFFEYSYSEIAISFAPQLSSCFFSLILFFFMAIFISLLISFIYQ